jgi:hypothetical protein
LTAQIAVRIGGVRCPHLTLLVIIMSSQLHYRLANSEDDPRILDLFKSSFQKDVPVKVWKWFNERCPTGHNRTYVIEDLEAGIFPASYSLLPIRMRLNGKEIKASLCTNVNTHPDYRGQGLFTKIGHFALDTEPKFDTQISIGMPNKNAYPGHMKVGWDIAFPLPFLVKHDCKIQPYRCKEVEQFDARLDSFINKISKDFSFMVMKNHRFLNWRVVERPDKKYARFIYENDNIIRGYVILKHFEGDNVRKSHILDIHADCDEVLDDLISASESFTVGRDELNLWTNPHNPYQKAFLNRGFYERPSDDMVIIHFNDGEKQPIGEGNWWFCLADNDVY